MITCVSYSVASFSLYIHVLHFWIPPPPPPAPTPPFSMLSVCLSVSFPTLFSLFSHYEAHLHKTLKLLH